jgi:uncharacterized protein YjbI with pentapeptide repeats
MKSEKSEGRIWKTNQSRFEVTNFEVASFEVANFEFANFEVANFEVAIFEVMSKWKLLSVNDCESRSPPVTTMEFLNSC